MRQHPHQVLPGLGLRRIDLGLDVLQRDQPFPVTVDDDLGGGEGELVLGTLYGERHEFPVAGYRLVDRARKSGAELPEIVDARDVRCAEQPARRVVLQRDRVVGVHGHQRDGYVFDQRLEMPHLRFLVGATFAHFVDDGRERPSQARETRTSLLEVEALRIVGEAYRIQEPRHFAIGAAHVAPEFGDQQCQDDCREQRRAVIAGLEQQPYGQRHRSADRCEAQDQCDDEKPKYHAFPCAGKAKPGSVPVPLRLAKY